uniref:Uncharacterized protein n=1 Tax=Arundo donax TaxID=35708 RepID=A0A0A9BFG8_ARUDO
MVQISVLSNCT